MTGINVAWALIRLSTVQAYGPIIFRILSVQLMPDFLGCRNPTTVTCPAFSNGECG